MRPVTDEPEEILEASHPGVIPDAFEACVDDRPAASPPLPPPGNALRERREERGLTLDDLARTTKISKNVLRAIEASDVTHLPASIYTRGFVKAYAREVGLHPEETADTYLHAIEPLRDQHSLIDDGAQPPAASAQPPVEPSGDARHMLAANQLHRFGRIAMAASAVGLILYFASLRRDEAPATASEAIAPLSDVTRAGGVGPDDLAGGDAAAATLIDTPLRVELAPQGPCWVSIRVGGETVLAKLLQAGDRETIHLSDEAVVRVGEPGALSYSINGRSGRALGPAGTPVTVRISKDNFRDFLSS